MERPPANLDSLKQQAAEAAAGLVEDGMLVGLGSGSTAAFAVQALGRQVKAGLRIRGVATSERTADLARVLEIPLIELGEDTRLDLTIDGADEVVPGGLDLIKGHGGALLREKIVASVSKRLIIVVDETKITSHLGRGPVPVEVTPFGWQSSARRVRDLGARPSLRTNPAGQPFISDGGHYILDCVFAAEFHPATLAEQLDRTVGVVEHGLFLGMAAQVYVASASGVNLLSRTSPKQA
jgi:ribose 5-phosphate isomerase A